MAVVALSKILNRVLKKVVGKLITPSFWTEKYTMIRENSTGWQRIKRADEAHGYEGIEPNVTLGRALGVWEHIGKILQQGGIFTVTFPNGTEYELEFPTNLHRLEATSQNTNKPKLQLVVNNDEKGPCT